MGRVIVSVWVAVSVGATAVVGVWAAVRDVWRWWQKIRGTRLDDMQRVLASVLEEQDRPDPVMEGWLGTIDELDDLVLESEFREMFAKYLEQSRRRGRHEAPLDGLLPYQRLLP